MVTFSAVNIYYVILQNLHEKHIKFDFTVISLVHCLWFVCDYIFIKALFRSAGACDDKYLILSIWLDTIKKMCLILTAMK